MHHEQQPHPIDIHVGNRVRILRRHRGLSQEQLGAHLELTFQQVQKYERGTNRISASKLYEIARALKKPIAHFFEGFADGDEFAPEISSAERSINVFLSTPEGLELSRSFPNVRSARQRRRIVDLVRSLAEDDETEDDTVEPMVRPPHPAIQAPEGRVPRKLKRG